MCVCVCVVGGVWEGGRRVVYSPSVKMEERKHVEHTQLISVYLRLREALFNWKLTKEVSKIDERTDVPDPTLHVYRSRNKPFLNCLMFTFFKVSNYNNSKLQFWEHRELTQMS